MPIDWHYPISSRAVRYERNQLKSLRTIAVATVALFLPLHLWRTIYPFSDWAALPLSALAIALFIGTYAPAVSIYRARLDIAVHSTSPLSKLLTGRLHAGFITFVFIFVALPVLAWRSLTAEPVEVGAFIALSVGVSSLTIVTRTLLQPHLTLPFSRSVSIMIGTVAVAAVFVPLLAWINRNYVFQPGEFCEASLLQAVTFAINELPARRGWIAEILSVFYAMDAAKLWLVVQLGSSRWATIFFSLDSALVGFVVAHASAILTIFISDKIEKSNQ